MRDRPARRRPRTSGEKMIRLDPPPMRDASPRALPDGGLLDQFRGWLAASPREYRWSTRHAARTYVVWLGWWRGGDEFFASTARLSNISRGGALVFLPHPPPEAHPV